MSILTKSVNNSILVLLTSVRQNPGPGTYEPKNNINNVGKYFVSTIKNIATPSFSQSSQSRFSLEKADIVPGPGAYTLKIGIAD